MRVQLSMLLSKLDFVPVHARDVPHLRWAFFVGFLQIFDATASFLEISLVLSPAGRFCCAPLPFIKCFDVSHYCGAKIKSELNGGIAFWLILTIIIKSQRPELF